MRSERHTYDMPAAWILYKLKHGRCKCSLFLKCENSRALFNRPHENFLRGIVGGERNARFDQSCQCHTICLQRMRIEAKVH